MAENRRHNADSEPMDFETFVRSELRTISGDVRFTKQILTGNGEPSKGLVIRFDRVERTTAFQNKVLWVVFVAIVGVVVTAAWTRINQPSNPLPAMTQR